MKKILIVILSVFLCVVSIYIYKSKTNKELVINDYTLDLKKNKVPKPPEIIYEVSKHQKELIVELTKKCNYSGNKSELAEACDYKNVRNIGVILAGNSQGEFNLGQICEIWDYSRKKWRYVNDPVTSFVSSASNTIKADYSGDCDDFAVLICSLLISIGGEARINYAVNTESGHAFTEVNIGKTDLAKIENYIEKKYNITFSQNNKINYRLDREGNRWLNLDWFSRYPGGEYFNFTSGTSYYVLHDYCENF